MSGECQQCATGEEKSHPSYAPNVAVLLIRQSDHVLRYAKLGHSRHNLTGCYAGQQDNPPPDNEIRRVCRKWCSSEFPKPNILLPFHTAAVSAGCESFLQSPPSSRAPTDAFVTSNN